MQMGNDKYDAIVIGSGIGSLSAAALLAKERGQRVLVLEKHFNIGGQTHEFKRKGKYEFDVGLHYIGGMDKGSGKAVFDYLTEGRLQWNKMPDEFEKFVYPDFEFKVPSNPVLYRERLADRYPAERAAIAQYFEDVKAAAAWYSLGHLGDAMPAALRPFLKLAFRWKGELAALTVEDYLNRHFRDPQLKALLASQWGDYGLPPAKAAFGMHALVVTHYWRGGWYPVGGAKAIARAIIPVIERAGGQVLSGKTVTEILIEKGRATGARAIATLKPNRPPVDYRAPLVISGAGAVNTYLKLIPRRIPIPFRDRLASLPPGTSAISVYLGLKDSPSTLGIRGENHWVYDGYDHNKAAAAGIAALGYYLSFASMKNPQAKSHTAEIITFAHYERFAQWAGGRWKKRGADYEQLKQHIARELIAKVDRRIPGFAGLVDYIDVSTPLTMEHFQGNPHGEFYGLPATAERLFQPWTHAQSPVKNLYLTGCDVMSPGVVGAMIGGVKTAGVLLGPFGFFRLMKKMTQAERGSRRRAAGTPEPVRT
ncbi:MAG TPA: NAD(P)/FAD-dependent oxidoreductase [Noviherbaspirillum sp.]|uniref:phytoene desaturase family protein n=1 Tax=Noviherbaspirillum sp. TaxID=1926288 RepID=UPI002D2317CE|nr:NAD(P)/FAD-dependent oxidoreductase [Noviherbaspirillum sp.]HYD94960.1 NAD(P)/FAD-dependent oxidoreductase [Noviherbaspirillum sp.]